ncbi:MAG: hypothetical protein MUF51_02120 [Vicinamibacteria bacterium]|jgi:hypothetical protein|nr:hypothetical protein [Vicinamibacteria bacterium]
MAGDAGRAWLACPLCPTAIEAGASQAIRTYRPGAELRDAGPRLAFWLFRVDPGRAPIWIAAFRCFNQPSRPDIDMMLTTLRHDPPLDPAPLGARLARGPQEAAAILAVRDHRSIAAEAPQLVSLSVECEGARLHERLTGWSMLAQLVRPSPLE